MDESSNQYIAYTIGKLGFFVCNYMPFRLCNVPATFQWLMQNCLGKLNLLYCLIYLNDIVIFSHIAEKHLHCLCVVFDWFREHNLKLKPSKCNFFREEITYLAHQVQKDEVWPSNSNLKAIAECTLPKTYIEVHAFLGLVGHFRRFIKGFTHIAQLLNEHLTGEGASRKSEWVTLSEDALKAFEVLKQCVYNSSGSDFHWLYQTIFVGDWCIQRWVRGSAVPEAGGWMISHLSPMAAEPSCPVRKSMIWQSLSF